jgi:hypothetical protein
MFYVYEFYIVETDEIIYVGKGTGARYKVRYGRNTLLQDMFEKYNCDSRIVKEFDNEKDAFRYEYERIKELKEKGLCKCNIHSGGAGGSSEYWTDELRKEYSENNIMKDESQRKRMSEHNPMKNPEISSKVNSQKKRPVIVGDKEYDSVKEACKANNVCFEVIQNWCNKGINQNGELCRYKDKEQVHFDGKRYNKGGCKPLTYCNKQYESAADLAEELNCTRNLIYRWLKNGFDNHGNSIRYNGDNRELKFDIRRHSNHTIIVNGIHYNSIKEAADANGVSVSCISYLLKKKRKSKKLICGYDYQQPSQENVDKSILEGSETNG